MFKIEREIKKGAYMYALVPDHPHATKNGYVLLHRVVVENHLGRVLSDDEVVHHKDRNKFNNNIENLEVLTNSEHAKLHAKKGRTCIELVCPECGRIFYKEKREIKKDQKQIFCSRKCNGLFQRKRNWKAK